MKPTLCQFPILWLLLAFIGRPACVHAQTFAGMPFTETFESGSLQNYWSVSGTGPFRGRVASANAPHGGFYHYTMDCSLSSGALFARNELTLGINLAGYTNVVLTFWVKSFGDEQHGPPPTPFSGGADFDGVAIGQDGVRWYEVQGLRNLSTSYVRYTVNLDAGIAAYGLAYNSTFRIRFNQYDNLPIGSGDGISFDDIAITGDQFGVLHHFNFSTAPTPQLVNAAFPVTITAVDGANKSIPTFNSTVNLWGLLSSATATSATLLGSPSWEAGGNGPSTVGYSFTPSTNITVTHLRHYSGGKVSIWTDGGVLLASQNVQSINNVWVETPLPNPLVLSAGNTYRVGLYVTDSEFYYYRNSTGPYTFADGTIDHEYSYPGDGFPIFTYVDGYWPFVDLRYVPLVSTIPVNPNASGNFVNGSWSGSVTVTQALADVRLHASDAAGHAGDGNNFAVLAANDLALTAFAPSAPVPLGANLDYTLNVLNAGPAAASGVVVSNTLPANATFVSFNPSQGTYATFGQMLVWNVGTVAARTNVIGSIAVAPTSTGFLTNSAVLSRTGADGDLSNNSAALTNQVLALGVLSVNPATGLTSTGIVGGPFVPLFQVYVLSNAGMAALTWNVVRSAPWVSRSATTGSLGPGDTASVALSLNTTTSTLPPGNYFETILFTNTSTSLGTTTRLINLNIASNNPPVAFAQNVQTVEDTPVTITLQGADPDGDSLTGVIMSLPSGRLYQTTNGTTPGVPIASVPALVASNQRQVIYVPPTNAFGNGVDAFLFRVSDGRSNSSSVAVTIDVTPINDPPQANADTFSILPGTVLGPFDLLANDSDAEGDSFSLVAYTQPGTGTLTALAGGTFTYTPDPRLTRAVEQFTYTISDGHAQSTGNVTINIGPLLGGDWPTMGNGPQRTGYYPSAKGSALFKPVWTNALPGAVNQVAVGGGKIFVTTTGFILAALEAASGRQLWRDTFAFGHSMAPPTYDNGRVFFQRCNHETDTQLRCVDATNGAVLWTSSHGAQWDFYYAPLVANDGVWVNGGTYGGMYGFDSASGGQRFFDDYNDNFDVWTPTWHSNMVYSWVNGIFRATAPVSGAVVWSNSLPWSATYYSMNTVVAARENRAYVMATTYLYAIDLLGRSVAWAVTNSVANSFRGSPAVTSRAAYCSVFAGFNSEVRAYSIADGSSLGAYTVTNDNGVSGQPIVTDDTLLVASSSATYIFNLETHALMQTLPIGGSLSLANGVLYIAGGTTLWAYVLDLPSPSNDVAISLSPLPTNTLVLQPLSYTISVTNSGPSPASGLNVTNLLMPGVTVISAIASQGTTSTNGGIISASLGALAGGATATIDVTVIPSVAGNLFTSAHLTRSGLDPDTLNNDAQAGTAVLPPVSIGNVSLTEGNKGTNSMVFNLTIPVPSSQTLSVNYATADGTASASVDYVAASGIIIFPPGTTNQPLSVTIRGDTVIEPDEVFYVRLSSPVNAALVVTQALGTIVNDDGLPGRIDHFSWSPIPSPQYKAEPFAVSLSARDASDVVVTNFNGAVPLGLRLAGFNFDFQNSSLAPWAPLNIGNPPGPYELVQFDVRGEGNVSQAIRLKPDSGGSDGVAQRVPLTAGVAYTFEVEVAVGNETGGNNGGIDLARILVNNTQIASTNFGSIEIGQTQRGRLRGTYTPAATSNSTLNVSFTRGYLEAAIWCYIDNQTVTLPSSSTNYGPQAVTLTNGVWSGTATVLQAGAGLAFAADDADGHTGASGIFAVLTNHIPIANSISFVVTEDTAKPIVLTGSDPENDPLTFGIATPPSHGTLSGAPPTLTYLPNTNYWGADSFAFSLNDGKGNTVTGQVAITVVAVADIGFCRLDVQRTNGVFQLVLFGEPYEHYRIEASADLMHWTTVTNLVPTNGLLPFVDPDAALFPRRFYRAASDFTPPQLSFPHSLVGGDFQLTLGAAVGRTYQVLSSTNLIDWTVLTNILSTAPAMLITDPAAPAFPRRFYRGRLVP